MRSYKLLAVALIVTTLLTACDMVQQSPLSYSVSGTIWSDSNRDGLRQGSESVLGGFQVDLLAYSTETTDWIVVDSTTTEPDGSYEFANVDEIPELKPSTTTVMRIFVHLPEQSVSPYQFTLFSAMWSGDQSVALNNSNIQSEGSDTGYSENIPLLPLSGAQTIDYQVDAGLVITTGIGGRVWSDTNLNGIMDEGEGPIPNLRVRLFTSVFDSVGTTLTDEHGDYFFAVPSGDYLVKFDLPADAVDFTIKDVEDNNRDQEDSDSYNKSRGLLIGWTEQFNHRDEFEFTFIDAGVLFEERASVTETPQEVGQVCPPGLDASVYIVDDPSGHQEFINMPGSIPLSLSCNGQLVFSGPAPFVMVSGSIDETGAIVATGTGTVAGYDGISVTMDGSLTDGMLEAHYSMGTGGGLPGGQAITYLILGQATDGSGQPAAIEASPAEINWVSSFAMQLVNANHAPDPEWLAGRLHPAIVESYGEAACLAHAANVADATLDIEVVTVYVPAIWEFSLDGADYSVADVYTVDVIITRDGESSSTQTHFGVTDGLLTWFTDCGDPLP